MHYRGPLYLASQSRMRRHLLEIAHIPFTLASQSADEAACNWLQEPHEVARSIARFKMEHTTLPPAQLNDLCFVVTADTICVDHTGTVHGKPATDTEAIQMLSLWRKGCTVITAFCLEKKQWSSNSWMPIERIENAVTSQIDFSVPDEWIAEYLKHTPSKDCAGAMAIEEYGFQFVRVITGSYSNILGLPLCEVREALTAVGFFIF